MKQPDWSTAPEGAEYGRHVDGLTPDFYKTEGGVFKYWNEDSLHWMTCGFRSSSDTDMILRPATPQWSGTAPPPVGTVCEVMSTTASGEWLEATIIAHDGDKAVYRIADGRYMADTAFFQGDPDRPLFRPIRTPEQIAAEERDAGIEALFTAGNERGVPAAYSDWAWMYDHGCRMTAEDER